MSKTPIYDFVQKYAQGENVRLHMPGHKGKRNLGCEMYDITEICGADSLFEAEGIIAQSERNLSSIFETRASFYSTEVLVYSCNAFYGDAVCRRKKKGACG